MSAQQGFDLGTQQESAKVAESRGVWIEIRDLEDEVMTYESPNGEGAPPTTRRVRILVSGTYSSQYRLAFDRQRGKMIAKRRTKLTSQQLTENQRELAAACCLAWEGFFLNGVGYACTPENAVKLFEAAPHIQEQVEEQMQDHASFFRTASTS